MDDYENSKVDKDFYWAGLAEKGYQCAHKMMRCILPNKKPPTGTFVATRENIVQVVGEVLRRNYGNICRAHQHSHRLPFSTSHEWWFKGKFKKTGNESKSKRAENQALYRSRLNDRLCVGILLQKVLNPRTVPNEEKSLKCSI